MKQNERDAQRRQEDAALYHGFCWVAAALVLELFVILLNRNYISFDTSPAGLRMANFLQALLRGLRVAAPVGALLCLPLIARRKRMRFPLLPVLACLCLAVLGFIAQMTLEFGDAGVRLLLLLIPALGALGLAFHIYQREFFWSALFSCLGAVGLWMLRHGGSWTVRVYVVLLLALLLCALALLMYGRGGKALRLGKLELVPMAALWQPVALTVLLQLLAVVLAALVPALSVYLLYVLAGWLFGLLVYFTVKML